MKIHLGHWLEGISILLLLGSFGCIKQDAKQEASSQPTTMQTTGATGQDRQFDDRLLEIARAYKTYPRIGDNLNVTNTLCRFAPPNQFDPPLAHYSASQDSPTHGRKLYFLFVKNKPLASPQGDYVVEDKPNPVGEVVVKEAWFAEKVKDTDKNSDKPLVHHDGHIYRQGDLMGLFIMCKLDPKTPGTDQGWVYGTVTADGKTVTAAGRIDSCMGCHTDAPHDRLFGVAKK